LNQRCPDQLSREHRSLQNAVELEDWQGIVYTSLSCNPNPNPDFAAPTTAKKFLHLRLRLYSDGTAQKLVAENIFFVEINQESEALDTNLLRPVGTETGVSRMSNRERSRSQAATPGDLIES
jgi:allantoicase